MKSCNYTLCGYDITSWGNGTAYTVRRDGKSFFMQGDDASQLSDEMAGENPEYYLSEYMAALGQDDERRIEDAMGLPMTSDFDGGYE